MAEQEVENGRLVRRKKPALVRDKHMKVTDQGPLPAGLGDDDHLQYQLNNINDDGPAVLRLNGVDVGQELQDLKAKYERLVRTLRAHGINGDDGGELTAEQQVQLAHARQPAPLPAAVDPGMTDKFLAQLQEIRHRDPTFD